MNNNCVDITSSNCVIWDGPSISCIGLCKGDSVSEVVIKLANEICTLSEPTDLSTLSIQCLLDILSTSETGSRTLISVLQLLIDTNCKLNDLITTLQSEVNGLGSSSFTVDLKCLAEYDSYGNLLPYTEQSVIQNLITNICSNNNTIAYISGKISDLQTQINNIDNNPQTTEVNVSTCIHASSLPVSTQLKNTTTDYCNYKTLVGSESDIATSLTKMTSDMTSQYQLLSGWIPSPSNFMQTITNYELIIANLSSRIKAIENTCCAPSCDNISTGFGIDFIDDTHVQIDFTSIYGTSIPTGWTDAGSTMTITGLTSGQVINSAITITQDFISDSISLAGFTKGEEIAFNLLSKMTNGSLICEKCIGKTIKYQSDCCVITNSGSNPVIIQYSTIN